jgi:hypothetical protein
LAGMYLRIRRVRRCDNYILEDAMTKIEETTIDSKGLYVMCMVKSLLFDQGINTRLASALLARIVFDLYKQHTSKEHYIAFLDKCKEYWDADENLYSKEKGNGNN